jgi:hypothetical protein
MVNKWIEFVRKWSKDNDMTYMCAVSTPRCREDYYKENPNIKRKFSSIAKKFTPLEEAIPSTEPTQKNITINPIVEEDGILDKIEETYRTIVANMKEVERTNSIYNNVSRKFFKARYKDKRKEDMKTALYEYKRLEDLLSRLRKPLPDYLEQRYQYLIRELEKLRGDFGGKKDKPYLDTLDLILLGLKNRTPSPPPLAVTGKQKKTPFEIAYARIKKKREPYEPRATYGYIASEIDKVKTWEIESEDQRALWVITIEELEQSIANSVAANTITVKQAAELRGNKYLQGLKVAAMKTKLVKPFPKPLTVKQKRVADKEMKEAANKAKAAEGVVPEFSVADERRLSQAKNQLDQMNKIRDMGMFMDEDQREEIEDTIYSLERKKRAVKGKGLIDDFKKGVKSVTKKAEKGLEIAKDYGSAIISGRNDFPPKVRALLAKYGDETVVEYKLKRTPVSKLLTSALSGVSLGAFGKRFKRSEFDDLFHLFLEMTTSSGKRLSVEKNEVINMDLSPPSRDKEEVKNITDNIKELTINDIMETTKKYMGDKKFYGYSARDNNCQDFIVALLKSNSIGGDSDITFVKQDTKSLFEKLPFLRKFSNTITDLGASVNVITTGAGIENIVMSREEKLLSTPIYKMEGTGTPITDQQVSLNELLHFLGQKETKQSKKGISNQKVSINEIKKFFGKGVKLADQKASLNEAIHFFGGKETKQNDKGISNQKVSLNEIKKSFGRGVKLADQKASLNEAIHFFGGKETKQNDKGISNQKVSLNEIKKFFGKGVGDMVEEAKLRHGEPRHGGVLMPMTGSGIGHPAMWSAPAPFNYHPNASINIGHPLHPAAHYLTPSGTGLYGGGLYSGNMGGSGIYAGNRGMGMCGCGCGMDDCCEECIGSGLFHKIKSGINKGVNTVSRVAKKTGADKAIMSGYTPMSKQLITQVDKFADTPEGKDTLSRSKSVLDKIEDPKTRLAAERMALYTALPIVFGGLGGLGAGAAATALAAEDLGFTAPMIPFAAAAGGRAGGYAGDKTADAIGKKVGVSRSEGTGMARKGRFEKGSQAAKDFMASIRAKKG